MRMQIRHDDLTGPEIAALLQEHLNDVAKFSPPESIHALDLAQLRQPEITFWTAWTGNDIMGCIALKQLDSGHGEIKSMRTAPAHLRKGVGIALLEHLIGEATRRQYQSLFLETGAHPAFAPARRLYARAGFEPCAPFGPYHKDLHSVFMSRML